MHFTQFRAALGFLTRLPGGAAGAPGPAAWSFPIVGLIIGAGQAMVAQVALWFGLPPMVAAFLALTAGVMLTGGLHEDGLADTADGLWGGHDRATRLEIMRDSRIGSYGVLALILAFGLQAMALGTIITDGALWGPLMASGAVSRAAIVPLMAYMKHARSDGVGRGAGRPTGRATALALAIAFAAALVLTGWSTLAIALACAVITALLARTAQTRIGGMTGDILGATQMLAQIAALISLSA